MDVVGNKIGNVSVDPDIGVEAAIWRRGGLGFGSGGSGIGLIEEHLPLQVARFDEVAVDEDEGADAGASEQGGGGRAGAPQPTRATVAERRRFWPASPMGAKRTWRE